MSKKLHLKLLKVGVCRSSSGSEFHAAGLAWEKAQFSELRPYSRLNIDRSNSVSRARGLGRDV